MVHLLFKTVSCLSLLCPWLSAVWPEAVARKTTRNQRRSYLTRLGDFRAGTPVVVSDAAPVLMPDVLMLTRTYVATNGNSLKW